MPAKWVEAATSKQVENEKGDATTKSDWQQGYGYQFWQCTHKAFRGDGANGQFCIVLPEQDAVIAITADTGNMQKQLDVIWEKLLPAFQAKALPENKDEQANLKQVLAGLVAREKVAPKPKQ